MRYKILCSDLDGTLLTTKSDVSKFTASQIARIKNKMRIILVSARMPKAMRYLQKDLGIANEPIICYNGAYVLDNTTELISVEIQAGDLQKVYELAETQGILLGLYHKDEWYVSQPSQRVQKEIRHTKCKPVFRPTTDTLSDWKNRKIGAHKIMLMGTKESSDAIFPELKRHLGNKLNLYRSNDTLIEIAPKAVSKLTAIQLFLNQTISLAEVVAFGDNYNDLEMLQAVGCGVAVANAREEVKKIADHITLNNVEDGVAHFIKQHL